MKKLLLVSLFGLTLIVGCNRTDSLRAARMAFPEDEVAAIPQADTVFIVRKSDGSVWSVHVNCAADSTLNKDSASFIPPLAIQILPPRK